MYILLVFFELVYIGFSTVLSISYYNDPMKGEIYRTLVRIISLIIYSVFFYNKIIPKEAKREILKKDKILIYSSVIIIMLFPLFLQKTGFTNLLQLIWILSSFVVGFREEIFYRGFLQNKISSKYNLITTILITSLIFTSYHIVYFIWGQWITIIQIFLWSIFIGIIYFKTKNIILVSMIHSIYDAIPFITPFKIIIVPYFYGLFFILVGILILIPVIFKRKNLTTAST
jgi:membrane protease YdiL (CAAX protease family)